MSSAESSGRPAEPPWRRWAPSAFWVLAAFALINLHWLHLWGLPASRWVGTGVVIASCCLVLLGLAGDRWWKRLDAPGALICAAIATYLAIGTAVAFVADAEWESATGVYALRQIFFFLVLLAALSGGRALLSRTGVEPLLKGVLAVLIASCLVVLATPLLRYWDVLLTFRLPFRMNGAFTDPNDAGLTGCMTAALALALLAHAKPSRLCYVGLAVGVLAALASFSRSAILVVCGILIFMPLIGGGRRWPVLLLGALASGLAMLAVYAAVASGIWSLRDLALGRDLERIDFCLPLPWAETGLQADCEILLAARDTLAGDPPLNWRRSVPIDVWHGVGVDGALERVTELNLQGMGLSGRVPAELGDLQHLENLQLADNRLTGELPPELARFAFAPSVADRPWPSPERPVEPVEVADRPRPVLDVSGGYIERPRLPLPASAGIVVASADNRLCRPGQVDADLLADCNALLAARDRLADSAVLNWSESVPIDSWQGVVLGAAPSIRVVGLALQGAGLYGGIPPHLGHLDQLVMLVLTSNRLTGAIPPELGKLAELRVLSLGANILTGPIPPELGRLGKLHDLWLAGNQLTGPVPPELEAFGHSNLGIMTEQPPPPLPEHNESLPEWFCRSGQVHARLQADCEILLEVRDALAGDVRLNWREDVPIRFWTGVDVQLPGRVAELDLTGFGLNGRIPPEIGELDQLVSLRLSGNWLSGPIPPELGKLANLRVLSLSGNALTGLIPRELEGLAELRQLWLASNRLSGPIPSPLFGIPEHDLANGLFCLSSYMTARGSLLADCRTLLAVRDTLAGGRRLSWSLYTPVGFWQGVALSDTGEHVSRLDLAKQGLSGRIPPELGDLEQLAVLRLSFNQLTGTVPPELGRLANLHTLALESNRLTDPLPAALMRPDLALRLADNDFNALTFLRMDRRLSMWQVSLDDILDSFFVGSGLGTFRSIGGNLTNARSQPEGIHNLYLALFGEAGIVPLTLYCLFLGLLFRLRWSAPSSLARDVVIGWTVVMVLFGLTYHHLLTQGTFMFLAGLCCALATSARAGSLRG